MLAAGPGHYATENGTAMAWLEAAALLRGDDQHEPWSPGHPVYLLRDEV